MEPLTKAQIENIFKEIDQDHDGKITRENLTSTDYALSIFDNDPRALSVYNSSLRPSIASTMAKWPYKISACSAMGLDLNSMNLSSLNSMQKNILTNTYLSQPLDKQPPASNKATWSSKYFLNHIGTLQLTQSGSTFFWSGIRSR